MTVTTQTIIQFLLTLTPYQRLKFYRICNQINGYVNIYTTEEVRPIADFIRTDSNGSRNMISFSKKIVYGYEQALVRTHYKNKTTLLNDFLNNKKIYVTSY